MENECETCWHYDYDEEYDEYYCKLDDDLVTGLDGHGDVLGAGAYGYDFKDAGLFLGVGSLFFHQNFTVGNAIIHKVFFHNGSF